MDVRKVTFAGAGEIKLTADLAGPPRGAPVILLHGGGQTRHSWSGTMLRLVEAGYRVINLDLRGHGDSEWARDGDYAVTALAQDLLSIIATLERPAALIGASLGGVASFYCAGIGGSSAVAAVVMVDLALRSAQEGSDRIGGFMAAHTQGFASIDDAVRAVSAFQQDSARVPDAQRLRRNLRQRDDGRLYWHWDPRLLAGSGVEAINRRFDLLVTVSSNVTIPTLLVRGQLSDIVNSDTIAEMRRYVPQTEVLEVPGAGHMVVGDRNDAFSDGVIGFLQRHYPSSKDVVMNNI